MLNQTQRDRAEAKLLEERSRTLEALAHFDTELKDLRERAGELSLYRQHMADIGTASMEQEKSFLLASEEGQQLYAIDEALQRLYKEPEEFGMCERCGSDISPERLDIVPHTRYCAACQKALEAEAA